MNNNICCTNGKDNRMCDTCKDSSRCFNSFRCDASQYCMSCRNCVFCTSCKLSEHCIFSYGVERQQYLLFNQVVSPERYGEVLKMDFGFKFNTEIGWTASWAKYEHFDKLRDLPEYRDKIMCKITGLSRIPNGDVMITRGDKEVWVTPTIAASLGLQ